VKSAKLFFPKLFFSSLFISFIFHFFSFLCLSFVPLWLLYCHGWTHTISLELLLLACGSQKFGLAASLSMTGSFHFLCGCDQIQNRVISFALDSKHIFKLLNMRISTLKLSLQAIDSELGEQLEFSTPAAQAPPKVRDPPTQVALLCGGPVAGQQQSLTSAQTYLQQLQTHNPREGFQGDESVPMPNSNGGPETNGSEFNGSESNAHDGRLRGQPLQKRKDLTGIHFVPYFITSGLQAMPITAAELHGKSAATLEFESGQNRREVVSLQQLSQQLEAAADVALSTVPSRAGQLAAALEEAGVHCVGSSSEATQTASHKYRSACISRP